MKLSLRDLFWLVLVVGMACAWWADHRIMSFLLSGHESRMERYFTETSQNFQMREFLDELGYEVKESGDYGSITIMKREDQ